MGRQTTAKADARRRSSASRTAQKSPAAAPVKKSAAAAPAKKTTPAKKATPVRKATPVKKRQTPADTDASTQKAPARRTPGQKTTKKRRAQKTAPKKAATTKTTAAQKAGTAAGSSPLRTMLTAVRAEITRVSAYPLTTYYLILVSVLALTSLGIVMVLSASSITSYDGGAGSSFAYFNKQAGFVAIGLVLMFIASLLPKESWYRLAWPALGLGIVLSTLVFVPGLGKSVKGNSNWIGFGGFQLQPSEFLKVALALWLGFILARRFGKMTSFSSAMLPLVPGVLAAVGLVVGGNDLGTALVLMFIVVVCLFIGAFPWKYFLLLGGALAAAVVFFVLSSENRLRRIEALLTGHGEQTAAETMGQAWQSNHGLFSLASGGWLGVGLGASREKWSWLPEAHNDFIFAIIGEELGLVGSLVVVFVFAILAYGMYRVIMRSDDMLIQITTAGLFAWLIGQAAINIGVVTGLLPVIGLPLPFVSYGGSSIIASLLGVGVLLSFARTEPGAAAAIAVHKDRMRSSFAVLARKRRK